MSDTINLTELRLRRRDLEKAISSCVATELALFRTRTGVAINRIHVDLMEVTPLGSTQREYGLNNVEAQIDLTI